VKISFLWDYETFLKANEEIFNYEIKLGKRKYIGWFIIALLQFGVVAVFKKDNAALLIFSTILLVYWYVLKWQIVKLSLKKVFSKDPFANKIVTLFIDKNNFILNEKSFPLSSIKKPVKLKSGYYFTIENKSFYLPYKVFKSSEEKNKFISFFK
jgi:hypothetical protein